jgi:hypothetical protein
MKYFMITWVGGEASVDEFETASEVVSCIEEEINVFDNITPFSSELPDTGIIFDDYRVLIKGDIVLPTIKIKATEVSIE